jgi:hypothetical protein
MKFNHAAVCLAGMVSGLVSMGCATPGTPHAYDGAARDPAELALVLGTTNKARNVMSPSRERISITRVDDDETIPWYSLGSYPSSVYILPGKRKLDVQYEYVHGVARGPIWVEAQSNRAYQVKVMNPQSRTERVYFVIQDVTAQTLVGGQQNEAAAPVAAPAPAPAEAAAP